MGIIVKKDADKINQSQDETDFLLSNSETKTRLLESVKNVNEGKGLKKFSLQKIKKIIFEKDALED